MIRRPRTSAWLPSVLGLAVFAGCLGDAVGPSGEVVVRSTVAFADTDSVLVGVPAKALTAPVSFRALAGNGTAIGGAHVTWTVAAGSGHLEQAAAVTAADGSFSTLWVLGTKANDVQALRVEVATAKHHGEITLKAIARPVDVATLRILSDTTILKLGNSAALSVQATDPYGNTFTPSPLAFSTLDASTVTIDTAGVVHPVRRGFARVVARSGTVADTAMVHVIQVVKNIQVARDTIVFTAIGQVRADSVGLVDDTGLPVLDSLPSFVWSDSSLAQVTGSAPLTLRSVQNGATVLHLNAGLVNRDVTVRVQQLPVLVVLSRHTVAFDALGDTTRLTAQVTDSLNVPIGTPGLALTAGDSTIATVGADGLVRSVRNGATTIVATAGGVADTAHIQVVQVITHVTVGPDTIRFNALSAQAAILAVPRDRLSVPVVGAPVGFATSDSTIAAVTAGGTVRAIANGAATVVARSGGDSALIHVQVVQVPVRVLLPTDTIRFVAFHETQSVAGIAVDSLGYALHAGIAGLQVTDTSIAQQLDSQTIRSVRNGATTVRFSVAGLPATAIVQVAQVPDSLTAAVTFAQPILTLHVGDSLPIACHGFDRDGFSISGAVVTATSPAGTVTGATCALLRIQHSGFDTLLLQAGTSHVRVPVVVAAAPIVSPAPHGQFLVFDSMPSGTTPWATSARRNSQGKIEVYYAAYGIAPDTSGEQRADLHRMVSSDGFTFAYDGVVLQHDTNSFGLNGSGIEHTAVVQRQDAPGWRMYYASGSFGCYGWQVFSAVSADERNWTKEPGVRITNGGHVPPQSCISAPWPAGEGIVVDQLPSGQWRMVVSTYEHILPTPGRFQITEWHSPDQVNWTYIGPILTTRQMPPFGNQDIYGPTIRQFVPGLYRMVFTADNRGIPGARRRLWSAVSTDRENWQIEGFLIGEPDSIAVGAYLYPALVDDHLYFLRQDNNDILRFATATVTMP